MTVFLAASAGAVSGLVGYLLGALALRLHPRRD